MPPQSLKGPDASVGAETRAALGPQSDISLVGGTLPSKNTASKENERVAPKSSFGLSLNGTIQKVQKSWEASRASVEKSTTTTTNNNNNNNNNNKSDGTADYDLAQIEMERVNNVKYGHAPPKATNGHLGKRSSLPGGDDAQHARKRRAVEGEPSASTTSTATAVAGGIGTSTPTHKTGDGTPVLRAVRSAPNKSVMHTLRGGTTESKEARQQILEKSKSGRSYRVFINDEGISSPTLGVPIPDGYEQYDDESCPWICPVRSCRNLLRNNHALSGHFSQAHRFCNLNDNGDGTMSIVGRFKAAPGNTAARVISQRPLDPNEPPIAAPRRPLQSRPLAGDRRESGSTAAAATGRSPGLKAPPTNPLPKKSPAPVNPPRKKLPDLTNPAPKKSSAPANPTPKKSSTPVNPPRRESSAPSTPTPSLSGGDTGTKVMRYLRTVLPEGFDFGLFTTCREGPFLLQLAVRREVTPAWIDRATGVKPHLPRSLLGLLLYLTGTPAKHPCPSCITTDSREQCIIPTSFFPRFLIERFGGSCAACFYRCTRWHHKSQCLLLTEGADTPNAAGRDSDSPFADDDTMALDAASVADGEEDIGSPVEEESEVVDGDVAAPDTTQQEHRPSLIVSLKGYVPPATRSGAQPISPPAKPPAGPLIQGGLISADVLDMEDWEIAPGTVRSTADEQGSNMAYSNAYLFSNIAVAVEQGVGFNLITLKPGGFHKFEPEDSLRLCSLSTGKVSVKIGAPAPADEGKGGAAGELGFRIGPNGMFKVPPGSTCSVQNRVYVDAVLHVTSIEI